MESALSAPVRFAHFPQKKMHDSGSAVSFFYRSKFTDCVAGAVPNGYPKLDLLWHNVIAGPRATPRKSADSKSRPVASPTRRVGPFTECAIKFPSTNSLRRVVVRLINGVKAWRQKRPAAVA